MALIVVLVGIGCDRLPMSRDKGGQIEVQWSGSERGTLSAAATAEWCSILHQLEIRAVRGDTGVAIVVHPVDTISAREYPLTKPENAESLPPAASIALRWVAQSSVKGFQGESGSVNLNRAPSGEWSGKVRAAVRSVSDTQRLIVNGTFKDLRIRAQARGCVRPVQESTVEPPDSGAQPRDTQLH